MILLCVHVALNKFIHFLPVANTISEFMIFYLHMYSPKIRAIGSGAAGAVWIALKSGPLEAGQLGQSGLPIFSPPVGL